MLMNGAFANYVSLYDFHHNDHNEEATTSKVQKKPEYLWTAAIEMEYEGDVGE